MSTPQSAIIPETITAAIYIEADVRDAAKIKTACREALAALTDCQTRFPGHELGMTIAFGADFWRSLNHSGEGEEIRPFVPLGNGLCPATQCDLMIHIQSTHTGLNYLLAEKVMAAFGESVEMKNETHGFRRHQDRGLDGFVDGTENPAGKEAISNFGLNEHGGSYVLIQRYLHNLAKWDAYTVAQQEESIGRSKESNEEFPKTERLPTSHLARTNIKENGKGLKIIRRSLPYGTASGEHGLAFIAYAGKLRNIEIQLQHMFGDSEDGLTDLLLERISTAISGAYYYAPSVERLQDL